MPDLTDREMMKLPDGKTCRDCRFFKRCAAFIGISGDEDNCDWAPSRFKGNP